MTQRDKWAKRPAVIRYREYADELRAKVGEVPKNIIGLGWCAYLPMPKSWSQKKKDKMRGQLHQAKPDRDNIDKGILDILFKSDSCAATGCLTKRWEDGDGPKLELCFYFNED